MLAFPQWRPEFTGEGCRLQRWMPAERFAPYFAHSIPLPPLPPQTEDEDSSGSSSPERESADNGEVSICDWRGCGAHFGSIARLSAHVARVHALAHRDGMFYCGWRGCPRPQRGFNARYKMLVHVRTHTNERPHTCSQCNKSFSRAENLKIHLRSHSGEKPYVCPYEGCGKAYSNSSDRFKHTRTHTVDKPYCCKVIGCNKRYTDPSSLRKHVKTYKHFVTEDSKRESSKETEPFSPLRENVYFNQPVSPLRVPYSPPKPVSPTIPPYNPILPLANPIIRLPYDQVTYLRPKPIYPTKVPSHEMSYMEYTQMYERTYRNYYNTNASYPVLRPSVIEKAYSNEEKPRVDDIVMKEVQYSRRLDQDMPLNLICTKRSEYKPIEVLVRKTDLPLDLSSKS